MPKITQIFLWLQLTLKNIKTLEQTSPARPLIPFYWKTSSATDNVPDYWNHGSIFIPGQDRFTMATKKPDIFPPWLTRKVTTETYFSFPFINMSSIREIMHKTKPTDSTTIVTEDNAITTTREVLVSSKTETFTNNILTTVPESITVISTTPSQFKSNFYLKTIEPHQYQKEPDIDTPPVLAVVESTTLTTPKELINESEKSTVKNYGIRAATPFQEEEIYTPPQPATAESTLTNPEFLSKRIENSSVINNDEPIKKKFKPKITTTTTTRTSITTNHPISNVVSEEFQDAYPFSVFLQKFLNALSVKSPADLFMLVEPFINYVIQLLVDGKLSILGVETNLYLTKGFRDLNKVPDVVHAKVIEASKWLVDRYDKLAADANDLINLLDDTFDEAEEEAMQEVLMLTRTFPSNDRTAEEIAHSFVNDIFFKPMQRVAGTWKGKTLFNMITDVVKRRISIERRFLGNSNVVYKFLKEPQLVDKYVKYKNLQSIHPNVDIFGLNKFRRNLLLRSNDMSQAVTPAISGYEDRNEENNDYSYWEHTNLKSKKTLRPNFFNGDTEEDYNYGLDSITNGDEKTLSNVNSGIKTEGHTKKINNLLDSEFEKPNFIRTVNSTFRDLKSAVKKKPNNDRKLVSVAGNKIRTQEDRYARGHSDEAGKYNTILLPTGHIRTKLVRNDIPKYGYRPPEDEGNRVRNVNNNINKPILVTKPYGKSIIHDSHKAPINKPTANKKAKPNRPFQHKPGPQSKINTNMQPKSKKVVAATKKLYTKHVIKSPPKSNKILKNVGAGKTSIKNNKIKENVADQKRFVIVEEKMPGGDVYSVKEDTLLHGLVKQEPTNQFNSDLKTSRDVYKAIPNRQIGANNKIKAKGVFYKNLTKVNENIINIKDVTPPDLQNFDGQINSEQLNHDAGIQSNIERTKQKQVGTMYNKSATKKGVLSNTTAQIKNNKVSQSKMKKHKNMLYGDDSTKKTPASESSLENSDQIIVKHAKRLRKVTQLTKTSSKFNFRSGSKHHHKIRHKKSKHRKHGHKPAYYSRKKYKKLKRKYHKLKRLKYLIKAQRQLYAEHGESSSEITTEDNSSSDLQEEKIRGTGKTLASKLTSETQVTDKVMGRAGVAKEYDDANQEFKELDDDLSHKDKLTGRDEINLFLEDFDVDGLPDQYGISPRRGIARARVSANTKPSVLKDVRNTHRAGLKHTNKKIVRGRTHPPKGNKPIFRAFDDNDEDEELQLKENLVDAFRHFTFDEKYNNEFRRNMVHGHFNHNDNDLPDESSGTDLEAVLKTNIYKAVKELLKK